MKYVNYVWYFDAIDNISGISLCPNYIYRSNKRIFILHCVGFEFILIIGPVFILIIQISFQMVHKIFEKRLIISKLFKKKISKFLCFLLNLNILRINSYDLLDDLFLHFISILEFYT